MMTSGIFSSKHKNVLIAIFITTLFLVLRLPGLDLPYHQDEWKNVSASMSIESAGSFFAHPPFMQVVFVASHMLFGTDGMRLFPIIFSIATVMMLYLVVRERSSKTAALFAVGVFSVCFYSILGSLMLDVDGSVLPFFFLLAVWAYDRQLAADSSNKWKWSVLLFITLLFGFLTKLSFILVIGTLIIDHVWREHKEISVKRSAIGVGGLLLFGLIYIGLLNLFQYLDPSFSISFMLGHANQYAGDAGRNWTQIIVQTVKAIYYLSPLLLLPLLFLSRESLKKTRVFGLYLVFGLVFYLGLFDFSRAALDKYLLFAVVPLAVIAGTILADLFKREGSLRLKTSLTIGLIIGTVILSLNFLPQSVVALYPKTLWFSRVLHGHWSILTPFNGGSGPLGFYVSFLFMASSFIASIVLAGIALINKNWRKTCVIVLIIIGLIYNGVFAEELLLGSINGSAPKVLADAVAFIGKSDSIKQVLTYNDTGAGPLSLMGKYAGRIYATPESESGYRTKFIGFAGQYLVVNIPRFDPSGFYYKFFAQCQTLFESDSKEITAKVYDCPHDAKTVNSL